MTVQFKFIDKYLMTILGWSFKRYQFNY